MGKLLCELKIPNNEILTQYQTIFSDWLSKSLGGETRYHAFLKNLLEGNVTKFTEILSDYLMDALSYRDISSDKKAEAFYHGFVAALVASVRETHWVDSNKESGRGLYNVMLTPKSDRHHRALILEFKHAKKAEPLDAMAEAALAQIERLEYEVVLHRYPHATQVLKVGLAFSGKEVRAVYKEENRLTKQESSETWTKACFREDWE
ncbi:MAG: PD-(D/E)XK nuclease domain-containing protein [Gammaproteobacteria bacterium]|nr:PD-(D/E)XK nuclease domain-containing protein [Gammaproteobacteria bacterium]